MGTPTLFVLQLCAGEAVLHVFALRPDAALSAPDAPFTASEARFPAVLEALGALLDGEAEAEVTVGIVRE